MKKLLVVLMACAVSIFIITGCGMGDACDDYVDLVCEKCGEESDTCKQMEEALNVNQESGDYECDEDAAKEYTDDLEEMSEDDLKTFCNPGV